MKFLQAIVLIFGITVFVNAQKGVLSGTIYNATGAVVPGAKVEAINDKGEKVVAESDNKGVYSLTLPFNTDNAKIAKYEIIVDLESQGFEKLIVKNFKFIPVNSGKMVFDIALDSLNPEPCGYGGDGCLKGKESIETSKAKVTKMILQKPLEKLSKAKNTNKRKNKHNKQ